MFVNNRSDFFGDGAGRKHPSIRIGAVNPDEGRVKLGLPEVDRPDAFLEVDVGFMNILSSHKILPVIAFSRGLEPSFDKGDRHIQENVQIRLRKIEGIVFCREYPVPQSLPVLFRGQLCALVGDVRIDITVEQNGTAFSCAPWAGREVLTLETLSGVLRAELPNLSTFIICL